MARAIGIDPGTVSFDVCGRDGDRVFVDAAIPTSEVEADPATLVNLLCSAGPADIIIGPSGYGLPWVDAQQLGPHETDFLLLSEVRDRGRDTIIGGLGAVLRALKVSGLPLCFAPAVIHLPSVPEHRKVNRIDMGTADKLCAIALGVWDQSRHLGVPYEETSFVYVELGGAFTALAAVENGRVVDGLGGTSGAMGYRALGGMDGELAYLLGSFPKELLCSGGVAWVAGRPDLAPEELAKPAATDSRSRIAWEAFLESLVKHVAMEMTVLSAPKEILLSGRLCVVEEVFQEVVRRLSRFATVRRMAGFDRVAKEGAQGAALIGQGLVSTSPDNLVEAMGLRAASGTPLDYIYVDGAEVLRRRYLVSRPETLP